MRKLAVQYVCQSCGSWSHKWSGKCDGCGAWNTLVEEQSEPQSRKRAANSVEFVGLAGEETDPPRMKTGLAEFDRVCGGGLVPGGVLLVGGDPGIGKSTLLLQVVAKLSEANKCAYVSGEEAVAQVRLRASRLKVSDRNVLLAASTSVQDILSAVKENQGVKLVIIDSIQTMSSDKIESAPGTVSQVRACAHELITFAKKHGITFVLVGHVTKEGALAGPRVLEHMVDTVLYFEGEQNYHYRILRAVKNRFGPTDEIGVFEMVDVGLNEVPNPSALFLNQHEQPISGSAIFAGMEGSRPILCEVQSLVAPSYLASPRRTSVGWDVGRLSMILAVLETRCGLVFGNKDVYLNVAGGLKISEPAADLAVAAALVSALKNRPVPERAVFFGEVGLGGEVRAVNQLSQRLKESGKLGFSGAFFAKPQKKSQIEHSLKEYHLTFLVELLNHFKN